MTFAFCLAMADMDETEQRCSLQSLNILFFKCFKLDGPNNISQFFIPRPTKYNLQDSVLNVHKFNVGFGNCSQNMHA